MPSYPSANRSRKRRPSWDSRVGLSQTRQLQIFPSATALTASRHNSLVGPRNGSKRGADISEAADVGLSLLGKFECRRDMADEDAGCHRRLDVLAFTCRQLERNRIFDFRRGCYGVLSGRPVDKGEAAGHRSGDDLVVHPNLGLNGGPHIFAGPDEVDTAQTGLQCRNLERWLIEAAWTRTTRQQQSDEQKGHRPDSR